MAASGAYNLFQVLLDPGDEVLLPSLYWLTYPELARRRVVEVRLLTAMPAMASGLTRLSKP